MSALTWILPVFITIAAFGWSISKQDNSPSGDYGGIGQGIGNVVLHGGALIVSLFAWLMWALLS